jgi:pimeloyl-ACP methyl ester carboxylesterase
MIAHERQLGSDPADLQDAAGAGHRLRASGRGVARLQFAASAAFGWPWLDPVVTWTLRRWYFPLSRLWAAAEAARGVPEAFVNLAPSSPPTRHSDRLLTALARFERLRAASAAIDAHWSAAFFPPASPGRAANAAERVAIETARHDAMHRYYAARRLFRFLVTPETPRVRLDGQPSSLEAAYGAFLADPAPLFAPPAPMPPIEMSRSVPTAEGRDFWLRFPSPSARLGDMVHARVYEPAGVKNPPTVIFGHGICVEFDHWNGLIDEAVTLCRLGIRVIRPEAPWHGRRRPEGCYGGERMIAGGPAGSLDLFAGAVREWAVLADWARRTSTGRLGFGGSSLGALTAQLAASRARDWPQALRPDALLLITHCEQLSQAAFDGDLARLWGERAVFEAKGWNSAETARYLRLLDPGTELAVGPDQIVTVLGKRDRITPYDSGAGLVDRWRVPPENRFILDRGHFSVPVMLLRDHAPFRRMRRLLA